MKLDVRRLCVLARAAVVCWAAAGFAFPAAAAQAGDNPHAGHHHGDVVDDELPPEPERSQPWDPAIVELVSQIPILDQGRVKPLSTYAGFALLNLNGARRLEVSLDDRGTPRPDDDATAKLTPVEWLLDCMFFPRRASAYRCFQLQTWEVLDALGLERFEGRKKRDRYSYAELSPGRERLFQIAEGFERDPVKHDPKNRTYVEEQLWQLARKMNSFEGLRSALTFAMSREFLQIPADAKLADLLGEGPEARFSTLLWQRAALEERKAQTDHAPTRDAIDRFGRFAAGMAEYSSQLTLWPPDAKPAPKAPRTMYYSGPAEVREGGSEVEAWYTMRELVRAVEQGDQELLALHLPAIAAFEDAFLARPDQAAMKEALQRARDSLVAAATGREQYGKIQSEIGYYQADLFFKAQWLYVLGFVAIAAGWLMRAQSRFNRALPWLLFVPFALHVAAIVWRGYLRARPPVSTLYETIPFITAAVVLVALVIELIDRRRVAVVFAALLGAGGLFLTQRFEVKEAFERGNDTMPQLQAVLDTNFWLSTHVTTVTIGYSAGLLAAVIAIVYVLGRLVGLKKGDEGFYKAVARMVYGVLCFGLLFSVVGTILGGVWANDSWGRFWGWDPKENGALMICLWELAILHARMGGYIRDLGLCAAAIFGANIVAFSWWGVNQLGVGLHAYGETDGVNFWLFTTYGTMTLLTLAGMWLAVEARARRRAVLRAAEAASRSAGTSRAS